MRWRWSTPAEAEHENTYPLGELAARPPSSAIPNGMRVFADETAPNRLQAIYEGSKEGVDGGACCRKMPAVASWPATPGGGDALSEHTLVNDGGTCLKPFATLLPHLARPSPHVHRLDVQPARQMLRILHPPRTWRAPNRWGPGTCLILLTVWRRITNGFTHQDPGLIDLAGQNRAAFARCVRVYAVGVYGLIDVLC